MYSINDAHWNLTHYFLNVNLLNSVNNIAHNVEKAIFELNWVVKAEMMQDGFVRLHISRIRMKK